MESQSYAEEGEQQGMRDFSVEFLSAGRRGALQLGEGRRDLPHLSVTVKAEARKQPVQ